VHLEEYTGQLMPLPAGGSGVDYNRAGVPLTEIVTDFPPDIESAEEAKDYLSTLRNILLYLRVCDGKMEEGSLRCEPNISVRPKGTETLGTKTELKNLNSFHSVHLGVEFELRRQIAVLQEGGAVLQETRGWNEQREISFVMRRKETENDYRYFPDPDLVPMVFEEREIEDLRTGLPELPMAKAGRYQKEFSLSEYDAGVLVSDFERAQFFEEAVKLGGEPKQVCNVMTNQFAELLKESGDTPRTSNVTPTHMVDLLELVSSGAISSKMGKEVLQETFDSGTSPSNVVKAKGLSQITDTGEIQVKVSQILAAHPEVVAKYKEGQANVKGYLVGQVIRATGGKANPTLVQDLVQEALDK